MSSARVSVIMNCLNTGEFLKEAIDSVFAQTCEDWEIIFWDNGSTDSSAEIAKSYGPKVRYFFSEITHPLGKARNLAMEQAQGEYIAFLDCDDIWLPEKLEKQVHLLDKNPETALVFTDVIYFNADSEICQIYLKFKPSRGEIFKELFRKYFICMSSVAIRTSAIKGLPWFDEKMKLVEDACFFLRLACRFKLDYCDEPLVRYRVRPDSGTIKDFGGLPYERDLTLKSLIEEFPGFEKKYEPDIRTYQTKTEAQRAINEWINDNPKNARRILKNTCLKKPMIYVLYFVTFLPSSTLNILFVLNYKLKNWCNWSTFW